MDARRNKGPDDLLLGYFCFIGAGAAATGMLHGEVKGRNPCLISRCGVAADLQQVFDGCRRIACGLLDSAQRPRWRRARRFLRRFEQAGDGFTCFFCARRSRL